MVAANTIGFFISLLFLGFLFFFIGVAMSLIYKLLFTKDNLFSKKILQKKINAVLSQSDKNVEIVKIYGIYGLFDKNNNKITLL